MSKEKTSQENVKDFWDTSDTVFENYNEGNLLSHLNGNVTLRTDKYNGFDNNSGDSWIYPTDYPVRKYQYDIVYNALFKNTLVVLPTGLGKTFIAAVVMYNFYRWYPQGKVIFMAPTRPLVAQQIEACYQIMGIAKDDTAEITGQQKKENRIQRWKMKRVFYATPQSVVSDIDDPDFPIQSIKLIVIDEAHKAKGKYAYCDVISMIMAKNRMFRVLALSATPGRKTDDVAEVVHNLLISHIEMRTEKCPDVVCYTHTKQIETIVVPLNKHIRKYHDELIDIIDPYVRNLIELDVIAGNTSSLSKGWLVMQKKKYQDNCIVQKHPQHSAVITDFACCISLYHALELLERHGLWQFINYFDSSDEKFIVAKDSRLRQFLTAVRQDIGSNPFAANATDIPIIPMDFDFGHPKYDELRKCLVKHINNTVQSQAIVFCEFRDSAFLIHQMLLREQPDIEPAIFIGQGSTAGVKGITQKQQIATMADFRQGIYNVLIATCVAEEGIDCGEVDLIICFDVTSKNPIRLVQRMGRTGRKRNGKVILLVTEGKEQSNLKETLAGKDYTNKKIVSNPDVLSSLCRSPRLIPSEFDPKCIKTFIKHDEESSAKWKQSNLGKSENVINEEDIPRQSTSAKSSKKKPPPTSTGLRKFFQPIHADINQSEKLADTYQKENLIESIRKLQTSFGSNDNQNDRLKIPTFWEVIRNETTPSALMTFAVKRNINAWQDKFVNQSLSDVEMSVITKVTQGRGNFHKLGGVDSYGNAQKIPFMKELNGGNGKYDPLFIAKLTERFNQVKQAQKMQGSQETAFFHEQLSDASAYNDKVGETTQSHIFDESCIERESKYGSTKKANPSTFLSTSTPLKERQNLLKSKSRTPLPSKKNVPKRNNSVVDSPLKRAFERSFNRSLNKEKTKISRPSDTLAFFGLNDILDLFEDDDNADEVINASVQLENTITLHDHSLYRNEKAANNKDINIRTPLTVISNEPQEYTVSQILKIVNLSNVNDDLVKTSQSSLKENSFSSCTENRSKVLDIGNIDDIFGFDDENVETHNKALYNDKPNASDEEDIIASSQSVISKRKLPSTFDNYSSEGSKNVTLTKFTISHTGDDMFASFSTTNSPILPSIKQPVQPVPDMKSTVPVATSTTKSIKSPTSTHELLSKVDRSPSMFNRKVNLSRLSSLSSRSKTQINPSNSLQSKSPLFLSCGHDRPEENKDKLSKLESDSNDGISQFDESFKMHRNSKKNYVIDDTILESQEDTSSKLVKRNFKEPKKPLRKCVFIQDECEASEGSSDEFENTSDIFGDSIICNDVHDDTSVDMRAMYLQSIKSPLRKNGFRLPDPKKYLNNTNIFSQTVVQDNDSDYDTSFVVDENEEDEDVDQEMTVLERAELILKMKRKQKRNLSKGISVSVPKRRKIIVYDDSSDEHD